MQVIGFLLRVGLVIAVLSGLFAVLDDGAPERVTSAAAAPVEKGHATGPTTRAPPTGTFTFSVGASHSPTLRRAGRIRKQEANGCRVLGAAPLVPQGCATAP